MLKSVCFVCGKKVRLPLFPYSLFFWLEKGHVYTFSFERKDGIYEAGTMLCKDCLLDASKNELATNALIVSRMRALGMGVDD